MLRKGQYEAVPPEFYGTPKEIWGCRYPTRGGSPRARAEAFLKEHAPLFGLEPGLASLEFVVTRASLRAAHVIFAQKIHGHRVRRGWVSVHLDRRRRVYLVKNRAVPGALWPRPALAELGRTVAAVQAAKRALPSGVVLHSSGAERMWFPVDAELVPAFRVPLVRRRPREWWNVFVHARTVGHALGRAAEARPAASRSRHHRKPFPARPRYDVRPRRARHPRRQSAPLRWGARPVLARRLQGARDRHPRRVVR